MQIVQTTQPTRVRLSERFLEPYRKEGDPFGSLLARSTYLTKYSRRPLDNPEGRNEVWTDTIQRVVEGNVALAPGVSRNEAELLFHLFWTGQALPPGRGLWTGGVAGIPSDAMYNCWYVTLRNIDDWCWTANQLMLGGGVGVGLAEIGGLPTVAVAKAQLTIRCSDDHPDVEEVRPQSGPALNGQTSEYRAEDSRRGWVTALRKVLTAAFNGTDLIVDLSDIRPRGALIRTFGGIACGPGPLAHMLRASWEIVRGSEGRRLQSVECLDITNHIGLCIKAGNVRRSALIVLGSADDQDFRDAKKDLAAVMSHRHTSNNSLAFRSWDEINNFDWRGLVEDNIIFGEPGILNLPLVWQTDPGAKGVNPCLAGDTRIAVADGRNSVTIRELAEEGKDVPVYSMNKETGKVEIKMGRHPRITGHDKRLVRVWLDDGSFLDTTPNHKFILLDGTEVKAQDLESGDSLPRFTKALERVKKGSKDYYRVHCDTRDPSKDKIFEHRLVARFFYPEEWARIYSLCSSHGFMNTGGLVVHHKDYNQLNNSPENLEVMTFRDHTKLHGDLDNSGRANGHWSGVSNDDLYEAALQLTRFLGHRFSSDEWRHFAMRHFLPQRFSEYRVRAFGTVVELGKRCARELGLEHFDPRVVRTLHSMLRQGYDARIVGGTVLVSKCCEGCRSPFEVPHGFRERSFCSEACGNAYINGDEAIIARRNKATRLGHQARMGAVKAAQAKVCSGLKSSFGRHPNRKEWSLACKKEGIPSRIGPTLKYGYRYFKEVLEAGDNYNHKVVRVEELPGEHTVYNITVDDNHTVAINTRDVGKRGQTWYTGVYVGQCGEVALHDKGSCNLAEVFPAKFAPGTDADTVFRLVTRYCLRNRLRPLSDPEAEAVQRRNMRLGVGLGGICDFDWTPEQLAEWYGVCRQAADEYADELGVRRPLAVTTTKPSGTISLLNGSSPGIHAPFAKYYIRRTRIAKNDPMAFAMMQAGVPFEEDEYDKTGRTWVFSFPMTTSSSSPITQQNQTLREQFERQAAVQTWWADNAVSATLNFDPETEKQELADCLKEFVPKLKSTSLLAKTHGYVQPPYEAIDEDTYDQLVATIDQDSPLVHDGDIEIEECEGGSCPIR